MFRLIIVMIAVAIFVLTPLILRKIIRMIDELVSERDRT